MNSPLMPPKLKLLNPVFVPCLVATVLVAGCATKPTEVAKQEEKRSEGATREASSPSRAAKKARMQAIADIAVLHMGLDRYALNNGGKFPDSLQVLVMPDLNGHRYLNVSTVPTDPWGREYLYDCGATQRVMTFGADGKPGGSGENADIDTNSVVDER